MQRVERPLQRTPSQQPLMVRCASRSVVGTMFRAPEASTRPCMSDDHFYGEMIGFKMSSAREIRTLLLFIMMALPKIYLCCPTYQQISNCPVHKSKVKLF
jgi:hypothetical protein